MHESGELHVRYMKSANQANMYSWSPKEDISWQSQTDVIRKLSSPELRAGRGFRLRYV